MRRSLRAAAIAATPWALWALASLAAIPAAAGVTNPDISVIGQPFIGWTDDRSDPDRLRLRPQVGESEFVFDAHLNPYARGVFVASLGDEGAALEEGYFELTRGLPLDLALRGGQYRVGFGRLNIVHPHAYPFADRPEALAAYLPGEEAFNDVGLSLSRRIPVAGEFSLNAALDWLQGDSFRRDPVVAGEPPIGPGEVVNTPRTRPGFVGRLSGFTMLGEQSALEFGFSAAGGTNHVETSARTLLFGADIKARLWTSPRSYVVVQGEALKLKRDEPVFGDEGWATPERTAAGGYFFADYNWNTRYNAGGLLEVWQEPTFDRPTDTAVGLFAGYALMEETTAFRLDWKRVMPDGGDAVNRVALRVIYSMGPHKAHQF